MARLFISFEGTEGSGKTTQIKLLSKYLNSLNLNHIITREPGGTVISEKIRDIVLDKQNTGMSSVSEALLYAAARAQLVDEVIKPSLDKGLIVISDRYVDSSLVYQGIARGLGVDDIMSVNMSAVRGLLPDVTILLSLPPAKGLARKRKYAKLDRLESESLSFHSMVYDGYKTIAAMFPERIKIINADASTSNIRRQICFIVNNYLKEEML